MYGKTVNSGFVFKESISIKCMKFQYEIENFRFLLKQSKILNRDYEIRKSIILTLVWNKKVHRKVLSLFFFPFSKKRKQDGKTVKTLMVAGRMLLNWLVAVQLSSVPVKMQCYFIFVKCAKTVTTILKLKKFYLL